ncbi:hypothetical protein GBAR_LOCUS13184, partial [Geodia barretti]
MDTRWIGCFKIYRRQQEGQYQSQVRHCRLKVEGGHVAII